MPKPDVICAFEELKDWTILPKGWVMLYRNWDGVGGVGINYLGGLDPLARIDELKMQLEAAEKDRDEARQEAAFLRCHWSPPSDPIDQAENKGWPFPWELSAHQMSPHTRD